MARQKLSEDELLERLARVFRTEGYEGASLSRLVGESGLQRASLYHRFPGGKRDMALAVIAYAAEGLRRGVVEPLAGEAPRDLRVRQAIAAIDAFYDGGRLPCVLEMLTVGSVDAEVRAAVKRLFDELFRAFELVRSEAGCSTELPCHCAREALVRLQGSLIVTRVSGDTVPFRKALDDIEDLLVGSECRSHMAVRTA